MSHLHGHRPAVRRRSSLAASLRGWLYTASCYTCLMLHCHMLYTATHFTKSHPTANSQASYGTLCAGARAAWALSIALGVRAVMTVWSSSRMVAVVGVTSRAAIEGGRRGDGGMVEGDDGRLTIVVSIASFSSPLLFTAGLSANRWPPSAVARGVV